MKRGILRLAARPLFHFAVLSVLTFWVAGPLSKTDSKESRHPVSTLRSVAAGLLPVETGYTVQDGKVVGFVEDAAVKGARQEDAPEDSGRLRSRLADSRSDMDALDLTAAYARAAQLGKQAKGGVFKASIEPHWFADNTKFWYRNSLKGGTKEFIVVDAEKGTRLPAFDHAKIAESLSQADKATYKSDKLPFDKIQFVDSGAAVILTTDGGNWRCDLTSYECKKVEKGPQEEPDPAPPSDDLPTNYFTNADEQPPYVELSPEEFVQQKKGQAKGGKQGPAKDADSPDKKWTAIVKDYNIWLKNKDGTEAQLTQAGVQGDGFGGLTWSPDSKFLVAYCTTPGEISTVFLIESSPKGQLAAKMSQRQYPRSVDKFPTHEMWVIDVDNLKASKVDVDRINDGTSDTARPRLRWHKDGIHFTIEKTDRGHQRFRIVEVDARDGKTRNLLDEKAETMVDHYSFTTAMIPYLYYLDDTDEILYISEMDGWKHIYLIDAKEGKIKTQLTKGEWVVRRIVTVDETKRQIVFQGAGKNADQDPYLIHYYRVNFDGTGLVALTDGNGNHTITYSPDNKYLVDTYSRIDMAPVHELRRVADGSKVCDVEKADISALVGNGWRYPEVFVSKARDGKTDIWGIVYRPQKFDENKKYPVIEYIYAGPHSAHVPKKFAATSQMAALAELGFIVVQIDGMGTAHRSRAFHDVCWKNLADAGFPDRILWIKALAKKYAYLDITRVGIYGTSAGGQNACGAVLFHPEFYKVAVASCGCHDNRLDKSSWNEAWMGLMGPHYEAQSNITNAHKLQGRLLLMVGELDTNVPPESTMRVVDALIKAKKDFELIVLPGLDHTGGGPHGDRHRVDFFVQHLLGTAPPNHNSGGKAK
jgi:dipeptidyl aminopeptidase/acylaminoacyl peptidase